MKLRKWNRIIHRDLGYIFCGMCIIYGLSGIALNHMEDWNPDYIIKTREIILEDLPAPGPVSREEAENLVARSDADHRYRSHFFPKDNILKLFLKSTCTVLVVSIFGRASFIIASLI